MKTPTVAMGGTRYTRRAVRRSLDAGTSAREAAEIRVTTAEGLWQRAREAHGAAEKLADARTAQLGAAVPEMRAAEARADAEASRARALEAHIAGTSERLRISRRAEAALRELVTQQQEQVAGMRAEAGEAEAELREKVALLAAIDARERAAAAAAGVPGDERAANGGAASSTV